jgi:hypothetical protein
MPHIGNAEISIFCCLSWIIRVMLEGCDYMLEGVTFRSRLGTKIYDNSTELEASA